jgi:hypothetical protein
MSKYKVILEFEYDVDDWDLLDATAKDSQQWLDHIAEVWHDRFVEFLKHEGIEKEAIVLTLEEYE